ncbi:HNH endonuclease family protein [Rarobacter faecitabidus]|uniref:Uncharacterized protein DUF1524 n=1 Tax=Rarobacter faecitabidus TaxID=13243 RepID=A0A542ZA20_RARFA|nr:HNH endonuclease family protein [Rarobacter faecitabidus]TQL57188.1 uncharacterized protein DUF1524 [Rarobacter faecitabidus]
MRRHAVRVRRDPRPEAGVIALLVAVAALLVCLIAGVGLPAGQTHRAAARYPVTKVALRTARGALSALVAAPDERGGVPEYSRDDFGAAWQDTDLIGCDTRNDILMRDLRPAARDGPDSCVVTRGVLVDPYTDERMAFERGAGSSKVQIDHVVALADAWRAGAWRWEPVRRVQFANDPENLLAVAGYANQAKGAATADEWLPPNKGYACVYAIKQITVKYRYALSVSTSERAALVSALNGCVIGSPR